MKKTVTKASLQKFYNISTKQKIREVCTLNGKNNCSTIRTEQKTIKLQDSKFKKKEQRKQNN